MPTIPRTTYNLNARCRFSGYLEMKMSCSDQMNKYDIVSCHPCCRKSCNQFLWYSFLPVLPGKPPSSIYIILHPLEAIFVSSLVMMRRYQFNLFFKSQERCIGCTLASPECISF